MRIVVAISALTEAEKPLWLAPASTAFSASAVA